VKRPVLLFMTLLLLGCAGRSRNVLPVDVHFSAIYVAACRDSSGLSDEPDFPEDTLEQRVLQDRMARMGQLFEQELRKYTARGAYSLVDSDTLADWELSLRLEPFEQNGDTVSMPIKLTVRDRHRERAFIFHYSSRVIRASAGKAQNTQLSDFHRIGSFINLLEHSFPAEQMARLFYPHPAEKD